MLPLRSGNMSRQLRIKRPTRFVRFDTNLHLNQNCEEPQVITARLFWTSQIIKMTLAVNDYTVFVGVILKAGHVGRIRRKMEIRFQLNQSNSLKPLEISYQVFIYCRIFHRRRSSDRASVLLKAQKLVSAPLYLFDLVSIEGTIRAIEAIQELILQQKTGNR